MLLGAVKYRLATIRVIDYTVFGKHANPSPVFETNLKILLPAYVLFRHSHDWLYALLSGMKLQYWVEYG